MIVLYILGGLFAFIFIVIAIIIIAALLSFRDFDPAEYSPDNL